MLNIGLEQVHQDEQTKAKDSVMNSKSLKIKILLF